MQDDDNEFVASCVSSSFLSEIWLWKRFWSGRMDGIEVKKTTVSREKGMVWDVEDLERVGWRSKWMGCCELEEEKKGNTAHRLATIREI